MKRRDVIVGLGGLAGSAGLFLGVGAFGSARIDRESNITVVNDSNGLLALIPNEDIAGVQINSGELTIDAGNEDPGVNVNSIYQFGKFFSGDGIDDLTESRFTLVTDDDPADVSDGQDSLESAFAVVNHSTQTLDVTVTFDLDDDLDAESGTRYAFELQTSKEDGGERIAKTTSPIDNGAEFARQLATGDSFGVSFIVNAFGGTTVDEIDGSLAVSATSV